MASLCSSAFASWRAAFSRRDETTGFSVRMCLILPAAGVNRRRLFAGPSSPMSHSHIERSICHIERNGRSTIADTVLLRRLFLPAGLGDEL